MLTLPLSRAEFKHRARESREVIESRYPFEPGQFEKLVGKTEAAVALLIRVQPDRRLNRAPVQDALRSLNNLVKQLDGLSHDDLMGVLPLLSTDFESPSALRAFFEQMKPRLDRLGIQPRGRGKYGAHGRREAEFVRGLLNTWINEVGDYRLGYGRDDCPYQVYKALIPTLKIVDPWNPAGGLADMKPVYEAFTDGFKLAMNYLNRPT